VQPEKLQRHLEEIETRGVPVACGPRTTNTRCTVCYYLDFEAVSMLNPPYVGMSPYQTMVTQYSLHRRYQNQHQHCINTNGAKTVVDGDDGEELAHDEYLADPKRDCRKELLENLLSDLGYHHHCSTASNSSSTSNTGNSESGHGEKINVGSSSNTGLDLGLGVRGSVLVYSSYEKTQLSKLAELFPEHAPTIRDIIDHRLVDLEKIIKDCVAHPDFCGRSSIKVTLPALVPGFEKAYDDLKTSMHNRNDDTGNSNDDGNNTQEQGELEMYGIADGGGASAAFAEMITGVRRKGIVADQTRTALLEYCKLDTLALVEIHKALWNLLSQDQHHRRQPQKSDTTTATLAANNLATKEQRLLQKRTVVELKVMLRERGLKVSGIKAKLIERLIIDDGRQ